MAARRTALASTRKAAGYTQESLAVALNVDRTTVIRWEAGDYSPLPYLRPKLARLLRQSADQLRQLIEDHPTQRSAPIELNPDIDAACTWLDEHTGSPIGTSRFNVGAALLETSVQEFTDRRTRRSQVSRSEIARALVTYYGELSPYLSYSNEYSAPRTDTTILSRPEWLDLGCPLTADNDRLRLETASRVPTFGGTHGHAIHRLAEAQTFGVRLTNEPVYQLLSTDVRTGTMNGAVGLVPFLQYALTMDCLEGELLDALAEERSTEPGSLPLRDAYLPTIDTVTSFQARLCAGGVLALCAIARPAGPHGEADYLLLVQERSSRVVNATGQLAVIPKGFHQPMADYQADTSLRHSLLREMEEELFGRDDLDNTATTNRAASPMHPNRLSEPMKWLTAEDDRLRVECTGFGVNLVSGNYEFASLMVIEDERFWPLFGDQVEANWESKGLRQYSSRNGAALTDLLADDSWSNEGLFAISQGLRRLAATSDRCHSAWPIRSLTDATS